MSYRSRLAAYYEENGSAIRAGTLVNALVYVPAFQLVFTVVFAGAIGGWVAGTMTARNGPALRNGALVGLLGPLLLTAVATPVVAVAWLVTGSADLAETGARLLQLAPLFAPLYALQGAIGSVAARWLDRLGTF